MGDGKVYLKTYFYAEYETNYVLLQLLELYPFVDGFIICECDYTHQGTPKKGGFLFQSHVMPKIPPMYHDKITYVKLRGKKHVRRADKAELEHLIHKYNEPFMRGYFTRLVSLEPDDIVISVDCDEFIYGHEVARIVEDVRREKVVKLKLRQFFYKPTYLWEGKDFISPTAGYVKDVLRTEPFPQNWRYKGKLMDRYVGVHLSWCLVWKI